MKALMIVTIFYAGISALFYFDGFRSWIGGSFFTELKAIDKVGEQIPLAIGVGLSYFWVLVGAVYYLINSKSVNKEHHKTDKAKELIAASKEL